MTITVDAIYRYPVKGLRGEVLDDAALRPGQGLAGDRVFGLARGDTRFDPGAPRWLPKQRFVMLMRDAELAPLRCRFDAQRCEIELLTPDGGACSARYDDPDGLVRLDAFVNEFLGPRREGPARLVAAGAVSFTDVPQNCLSLLNVESVRDLEAKMGVTLGVDRFRANILLRGVPAWSEFTWVGREIQIGTLRLRVPSRIPRCAATAVAPDTGRRDANVLKEMRRIYGHFDMGIYAEPLAAGHIARGDAVTPPPDAGRRSWLGHWLRFFAFLARAAPDALRRGGAPRRD